jgi:hypothetical protein
VFVAFNVRWFGARVMAFLSVDHSCCPPTSLGPVSRWRTGAGGRTVQTSIASPSEGLSGKPDARGRRRSTAWLRAGIDDVAAPAAHRRAWLRRLIGASIRHADHALLPGRARGRRRAARHVEAKIEATASPAAVDQSEALRTSRSRTGVATEATRSSLVAGRKIVATGAATADVRPLTILSG